jgi:uncharacterized membrane protein
MKNKSLFKESMLMAFNLIAASIFTTGVVLTLLTYKESDGLAYYFSTYSQLLLASYFFIRTILSLFSVRSIIKKIKNEKLDKEVVKRAAELIKKDSEKQEEPKAQA